ncbi:hypothetical protein MRX96_045139 [Rhipicephalus microplus]
MERHPFLPFLAAIARCFARRSSPFPGLAACLRGSSSFPFGGGSRSRPDGSQPKDVSDILAYAKRDEDGSRVAQRGKRLA